MNPIAHSAVALPPPRHSGDGGLIFRPDVFALRVPMIFGKRMIRRVGSRAFWSVRSQS